MCCVVDKTGTLTLGEPQIVEVLPKAGFTVEDVLHLAASAERYSEHAYAEAIRSAARERKISLALPEDFHVAAGEGIYAEVNGKQVAVGSKRILSKQRRRRRAGCARPHAAIRAV